MTMAVLHLSRRTTDIDLHAPLRQVSIKFMQRVLLVLQYEEASGKSILIKCIST